MWILKAIHPADSVSSWWCGVQVMLSSHANAKPAVTWTLPLHSSKIKESAMLLLKYVGLAWGYTCGRSIGIETSLGHVSRALSPLKPSPPLTLPAFSLPLLSHVAGTRCRSACVRWWTAVWTTRCS